MKEGEEKGSARGSVHWGCYYATALGDSVVYCSTYQGECVFITTVRITKLLAWGEGDSGGHVQRETTSRGLCGLVCPSHTSERGPCFPWFLSFGHVCVCVCLLLESNPKLQDPPLANSFVIGTAVINTHTRVLCVFITAVPDRKLVAWGQGDSGGHVRREMKS